MIAKIIDHCFDIENCKTHVSTMIADSCTAVDILIQAVDSSTWIMMEPRPHDEFAVTVKRDRRDLLVANQEM